jgi:hypothetical protein
MKTTNAIALGSLLVVSLAAFTMRHDAVTRPAAASSFSGLIAGDLTTKMRGDARFGVVDGRGETATVFTLSLGAHGEDGSILFTRKNGIRLMPGSYTITDGEDGANDVQALVMTGPAEHPTGVFRGRAGTLSVTSVTDTVLRGSYRIQATGFLAADPATENREIHAIGRFTAVRE